MGAVRLSRDELLALLAERILEINRPHPVRVGIDGFSASGKTTLGDDIGLALVSSSRQIIRASLDNFKRPWSESHLYDRTSGEGYYRNAYNYDLIRSELLEPLGPGGDRWYRSAHIAPLGQHLISDASGEAANDAILIADGVFLFRPEIDRYWDLRVFLTIDEGTVLERGVARDLAWEDSRAVAEALYRERYIPSERIYVAEADPLARADIVIDQTDFQRPMLIRDRSG